MAKPDPKPHPGPDDLPDAAAMGQLMSSLARAGVPPAVRQRICQVGRSRRHVADDLRDWCRELRRP